MCGRYTLTADASALQMQFNLDALPPVLAPRYNIAPTQPVPIVSSAAPRELSFVTWGLIPSWSKDPSIASKLINARGETVAEKPSFRSAFKHRRCLIPADGFFEWSKAKGSKSPYFVHLANRQVFAFAGLWEVWNSPHGDEVHTCTIITTEPNSLIRPLHNRMAVILPAEAYETWLDPATPAPVLQDLLSPYPEEGMDYYEVSPLVNSPANDLPEILEPYQPPSQPSLF